MKNIILYLFAVLFITISSILNAQIDVTNPAYKTSLTFDLSDDVNYAVYDLDIQDNGKILLVGTSNTSEDQMIFAARLYSNGQPDHSFGSGGVIRINLIRDLDECATSVQFKGDKILLAGHAGDSGFIMRLKEDGSPDETFSEDGYDLTNKINRIKDISTFSTDGDYKIIIAGAFFDQSSEKPALMCYSSSGYYCQDYGDSGLAMVCPRMKGTFTRISVAKNGNLIACGTILNEEKQENDALVAKFHTSGKLNKRFGSGTGFVSVDGPLASDNNAEDIHIDKNGKITICGDYFRGRDIKAYVFRLTRKGLPDRKFGNRRNGYYTSAYSNENDQVKSLVIQKDGKIILGGRSDFNGDFDFNLTRLHNNGLPDLSFGQNSWYLHDISSGNDNIKSMYLKHDEYLITVGNSTTAEGNQIVVARYNLQHNKLQPSPDLAVIITKH